MRFTRDKAMPEAGFDITSMVDVVLLLVIFFMMSSQFSRIAQRALDLPRESGDSNLRGASDAEAAVVIDLEKDGRLSVGGRMYELDRLALMISADRTRTEKSGGVLEVIVRADRLTPATFLSQLAGALSSEGITGWRLATTGDKPARTSSGGAP